MPRLHRRLRDFRRGPYCRPTRAWSSAVSVSDRHVGGASQRVMRKVYKRLQTDGARAAADASRMRAVPEWRLRACVLERPGPIPWQPPLPPRLLGTSEIIQRRRVDLLGARPATRGQTTPIEGPVKDFIRRHRVFCALDMVTVELLVRPTRPGPVVAATACRHGHKQYGEHDTADDASLRHRHRGWAVTRAGEGFQGVGG